MVGGNAFTLIKLNIFTWQRALATGQVVINQGSLRINNFAWAYNVESLEFSNSFVVIQTANQSLKQVRGSSSDRFVAGVNEQGLKAAIKAITEPQQFKVEKVIELSTILQDKKLRNVQFLSKVFEDLAGRGILPNSSHPNAIKLFILRVFLTSSAMFNPFLKWFNQQDPQGKLASIYKSFEQDFFNTIERYPNECATLKEMVSGEICQAVLESLLVKREISPESLYMLMQNSRWIKKQNLLDAIRVGITEVDSAINANTSFSGADIWKPLELFIQNVRRSVNHRPKVQSVQSNSELPKWLQNILPEIITDHLAVRWRDINASQKKRAEAREHQLVKAEAYYSPLAELLRMLSPNTDEYHYFDCISNPQTRFPLSYSAIGDADNTGKKRFNLTIDKPISIDNIENKLIWQQISFFFLAFISVITVPFFYLIATIILLTTGSLYKSIKYIFNGFIQIIYWSLDITRAVENPIKNRIKEYIKILIILDYSNFNAESQTLECIEGIGRTLMEKKNKSVESCEEFVENIFEELEAEFATKKNLPTINLQHRIKFFRVYFLSSDPNEINRYLQWFKHLRRYEIDETLNFQNNFRKTLDHIRRDSQGNSDRKDYIKPFVIDVINFILTTVIDGKENPTSYESIIEWLIHGRSFVSSQDLTCSIITDLPDGATKGEKKYA